MDFVTTTTVYTTSSVVGFHQWLGAPKEVAYLRDLHRHRFGIRLELSVVENDREVEFHMLKRELQNLINDHPISGVAVVDDSEVDFGTRSCEAIAEWILNAFRENYPGRSLMRVTVDEDGENGATIEVRADEAGTRLDDHLERHRGDDR